MGRWAATAIRLVAEVATLLGTAVFIVADLIQLQPAERQGQQISWQWFALFCFVVFVVLIMWQLNDLRQQIKRFQESSAELEIRFDSRPPYRAENVRYYRVGIQNIGPAAAQNVEVWLRSIEPEALPEHVLPSRLTRKGGDPKNELQINPDGEDYLDILALAPTDPVLAHIWIREGPSEFQPRPGVDYRFRLEATASNHKQKCVRDFILRSCGDTAEFYPTD